MLPKVKYCLQCGCLIAREEECDFYRYIALKYCPQCAADVERRNNSNRMYQLRKAARERRNLERIQTAQTTKENELLRDIVNEQSARLHELEKMLETARHGRF